MKTTLLGHTINYEAGVESGLHHLTFIGGGAAELFAKASSTGKATFLDDNGTKFKLVHSGYEYELVHA